MRIVENRTGIVRFRGLIVPNRALTCGIDETETIGVYE
jgi:hypothetical protein